MTNKTIEVLVDHLRKHFAEYIAQFNPTYEGKPIANLRIKYEFVAANNIVDINRIVGNGRNFRMSDSRQPIFLFEAGGADDSNLYVLVSKSINRKMETAIFRLIFE